MTTTSVTREIRLAAAIQYLACTRGDAEVILHLRQILCVIFILAERERQRTKERKPCDGKGGGKKRNLETRECASVLFVRSCFISVEGRVLVLSVSREAFACY